MAERTNPHADIIVGAQDQATPVFDKIKGSAQGMANAVEKSAQNAGKAVEGIGQGAQPAAGKIDNATKSIIQSIERATAAMKAGEKGSAGYFEELAKQRGVSGDALKPYIASLREAEAAQKTALLGQQGMAMSAKQTAAALRGVPAQITDIVVSLQGGQAPLTVLLQQGGQLRDVFGGIVPAARALGTSILGMLNPLSLVTVGVAALGTAYYQGSKEADEYTRAILLSGNAAGTTASEMQRMAANISRSVGTQAAAAEVLSQMASTGRIASTDLERFATTAVRMERDVGVAIKQTVAEFEELGKAPVEASRKLGDQYGYLTAATYAQIKALDEQGRATDAARLAQETYDQAMSRVADGMVQRLGYIERGWRAVGDAAKLGWDKMLNVGRPDTLADQIANVQAKIAAAKGQDKNRQFSLPWDTPLDELEQQLANLREQERMMKRGAEAEAERTAANRAAREAMDAVDKLTESSYTKQEKLNKALADYRKSLDKIRAVAPDDKRLDPANIAKVEANIREQYTDKSSAKAAQTAQSEIAAIQAKIKLEEDYIARLQERGTVAEKANEGERLAAKLNKELAGNLDAKTRAEKESLLVAAQRLGEVQRARSEEERQAKAIDESEKAYRKYLDGLQKSSDAIGQQADQQEAANASYGKSKTAIAELTLAQMKLALAQEKDAGPWSPEAIAKMEEAIRQQGRYVDGLKNADFTKANRALDEAVTMASEQQKLTMEELSLIGLTEVERRKIIAAREIELDLAKDLRDIDKMTLEDEADREILKQQAREKARIRTENAIARETLNEWQRTADEINRSLTDALMRGFESGKGFAENFRDTLKNMFNTLVLRPIISAVMQPVSMAVNGAVQGGLSALGGGSSLMGMAGNANTLAGFNTGWLTNFGATLPGSIASTGAQLYSQGFETLGNGLMDFGNSIAGYADALNVAGDVLGYGSAIFAAANGKWGQAIGSAVGTYFGGPIGSFIGSTIGKWADKIFSGGAGTPHTGGAGSYSAAGGQATGLAVLDQGLTFGVGERYYNGEAEKAAVGISQGIVQLLDSTAQSFGQQAGYFAATAFADDSSKDGAWGSLRIMRGDEKILDWADTQTSKWAPKEFSDGEAGQKEYLAAIARDTRDALKTALGDADWAKDMLDTLGDSVTLEGLGSVVAQINQAKAAFTSFGQYMPTFAGLAQSAVSAMVDAAGGVDPLAQGMAAFVENFYSESEKLAINTENVRQALQELGFEMPETRDEFKALVQAQLALGDAGAKTAAGLLGLSGAFAAVTPAAESAQASIASVSDQLRDAFGMTADAVSGILSDAVKNAETASEAQRMASQAFEDKFYGGALDGLTDSLGAMIQSSVIAPMMESLIAGSAASASLLASGGAVAAGAMASGGAAGGAASAAGGSSAAGAMASGGASAANAMVSGGSAAGAIVASAVEQARAQVNAYTQILSDPDVQAGIKDISKLMGEVAGMTFTASRSWGGGGYSAASFNASGASSEADKLAQSLKNLGEAVEDEIKRLRGINTLDSDAAQATLLAQFATATAAARAGDLNAFGGLTDLSKSIEKVTADSAVTNIETVRMRAWLANSLEETMKALGLSVPAFAEGGLHSGGLRLVGERGWEMEATGPARYWNQQQLGNALGGGNAELVAEVRALRAEVAALKEHAYRTARNTDGLHQLVDQVDNLSEGGNALRVEVMT